MTGESGRSTATPVVHFFLLTFAFSWMIWIPVMVWKPPFAVMMVLVLIGAFGPSIMGVVSTYRTGGKSAGRELWRRFFQVRRIPLAWWIVILALFPVIAIVRNRIDIALGGNPPGFSFEPLMDPASFLGLLLLMIVGGPLAEELGWRGFALDPLQKRRSALSAALIIGVVWAFWHLPLFLMEGTSQAALGFGGIVFWLWHIQVVAESVIYTWVYNHTKRSVLSAFMLHFMSNSTYSLQVDIGGAAPLQSEVISTVLHVGVAVVVVLVWGAATLARDRRR
jgi:membrane protease YdiL (CAAX protease family)